MAAFKKVHGAFWRALEWSTVMAALVWLFARAWTDEARDKRRLRDSRGAAAETSRPAKLSRRESPARPRA